jgi:large subunit ribosomal protein L13
MSTTPYFTKDRVDRPWYVVDAEGVVLGRLAVGVAKLLLGKTRAQFTPGQDTGGFVVIINADKIRVTGTKLLNKVYYTHSGFPGGLRAKTLGDRMQRQPLEVVREAVKGMLPHNKLGARLITKLKLYTSADHPHQAQQPVVIAAEQLALL